MAKRIGVATSTINYWENNHFSPRAQHMPGIVAFLDDRPAAAQFGMDVNVYAKLLAGESAA